MYWGAGSRDEATSAFGQPWEAARKGCALCGWSGLAVLAVAAFLGMPPLTSCCSRHAPCSLGMHVEGLSRSPSRTSWQVAQMQPPRCVLERLSGRGSA
ncbi:g3526 [Coccomyxa elongata]